MRACACPMMVISISCLRCSLATTRTCCGFQKGAVRITAPLAHRLYSAGPYWSKPVASLSHKLRATHTRAAVDAEPAQVALADADKPAYGTYDTVKSDDRHPQDFESMTKLSASDSGRQVLIRGRVSNIRAKGNSCFVVLRQGPLATMQACYFKDKSNPEASKAMLKFIGNISTESIVDIKGTVQTANVKSCTVSDIELAIQSMFVVSAADPGLPFEIEDAGRPEAVVEASQATDRPFPRLGQELRLDNRWLDLRVPSHNCIMRIKSGICRLFRESLYQQDFVEIQTPKLIGASCLVGYSTSRYVALLTYSGNSEGGSDVFKTDYFGQPACLAQSPQLYKQMAVAADLERVFEIGPVFRAENSKTRRHLCEFTGLDIEMAIDGHYHEVLQVTHNVFKHIFREVERRYAKELACIRQQYASEPPVITDEVIQLDWREAIDMLRKADIEVDGEADLTGAQELKLGELVKKRLGTDFFILDAYPLHLRPFYTMPSPSIPGSSRSYDMFLRGQEICSGAQRIHDADELERQIQARGIPVDTLAAYINSFRHAVKPHGGAGIGLERVVSLYLGLDNVRKASMFPRDPNRLAP